MKRGWKNYLLYSITVLFVGGLIYILVETIYAKNTGFETKTLWDWMDLLIVPLVLALGVFYLNRSERNAEREIATDRQQEVALQTYFDRMSELLLKEKLRTTKKTEVRDVARTRTITIMRVLGIKRNNLIIQFLREAEIITDENSILTKASMKDMDLQGVDLRGVFLHGADLQGTNLQGAHLQFVELPNADLQGANLQGTDLRGAEFLCAKLQNANLENANLKLTSLRMTKLKGVNFRNVDMWGAQIHGADLVEANLEGANLTKANLSGAQNITKEQLASVKSLKGATMPDGTIHK